MEGEALVISKYHSVAEKEAETPGDNLYDVETETSTDTLADRSAEVEAEKVGKKLRDVKGASLV